MHIEDELAKLVPPRETILTVGVFDGVHRGHQHLINHLKKQAQQRNLLSGVVTFEPHPQSVLSPDGKLSWLNDLEDRTSLLRSLGVELIAVLPFTAEVAQLSAQEFVQLLKRYLKMRGLVIGPDFTLGRGREGNATLLKALGQEMGFFAEVVPPFIANGKVISSTAIRQALAKGDLREVKELMGRPFKLSGAVIHGVERGRVLGFPTANLNIKPEQALPNDGVYATIAHINNKPFLSVTNIGVRPTFGGDKRIVEVYLLDYQGDLYAQKLNIDLISRLRGEKRFATTEELKAQIEKDIKLAKTILATEIKGKK